MVNRITRQLLLILTLAMLAQESIAQFVRIYTFSTQRRAYQRLGAGATRVNLKSGLNGGAFTDALDDYAIAPNKRWTGGTTLDSAVGFPIGFNFPFAGKSNRRFVLTTNGQISVGDSIVKCSPAFFNPFIQDSLTKPNMIAALAGDLFLDSTLGGSLWFQSIGTAPNRSLVVEYRNYTYYLTSLRPTSKLNFQIILNESGTIEFAYGPMTIGQETDYPDLHIGLRSFWPDAHIRFVNPSISSTSWASPLRTNNARADFTEMTSTFKPDSNLVYRFEPGVVTPLEMSVNSVTSPVANPTAQLCGLANVPVSFVVSNNGSTPITSFEASYSVNGGTPVIQTFNATPSIPQFASRSFTFTNGSINTYAGGTYRILVRATLNGDTLLRNDTASTSTNVFVGGTLRTDSIIDLTSFNAWRWGRFFSNDVNNVNSGTDWQLGGWGGTANAGIYNRITAGGTSSPDQLVLSEKYRGNVGSPQQFFNFRIRAVTGASGSPIGPLTSIPVTDSLQLVLSEDCGTSFRVLRSFGNDDLQAGAFGVRITASNITWVGHSVPVPTSVSGYRVGFRVRAARGSSSPSYRFGFRAFAVAAAPLSIDDELGAFAKLKVYPNPSSGLVTLEGDQLYQTTLVKVTALDGRVVYTQTLGGDMTQTMNLSHLKSGLYNIQLTIGTRVSNHRIAMQ